MLSFWLLLELLLTSLLDGSLEWSGDGCGFQDFSAGCGEIEWRKKLVWEMGGYCLHWECGCRMKYY